MKLVWPITRDAKCSRNGARTDEFINFFYFFVGVVGYQFSTEVCNDGVIYPGFIVARAVYQTILAIISEECKH
jgi:hypothetical protein